MCQPGRPMPQGLGHEGSPGLLVFHRAKSTLERFSFNLSADTLSSPEQSRPARKLCTHRSTHTYSVLRKFRQTDKNYAIKVSLYTNTQYIEKLKFSNTIIKALHKPSVIGRPHLPSAPPISLSPTHLPPQPGPAGPPQPLAPAWHSCAVVSWRTWPRQNRLTR